MNQNQMRRRSPLIAYVLAAIASAGVWFGVTIGTGKSEAWDSAYYFIVGLPALASVVFALGYAYPRSAWRWAVTVGAVQVAACILWKQEVGSMLPFGVLLFALITAGLVLVGNAGVAVANWRQREYTD